MYDALSPAPGVRVMPNPRIRVEGLTPSQRKAMHRPTLNGAVLGGKPQLQVCSLGIMSTSRSAAPLAKRVELPRQGKITRSLCHLARADGPDMGKAATAKLEAKRAKKKQREVANLLRRALRAAKGRQVGTVLRLCGRLKQHHARLELQQLQRYVQSFNDQSLPFVG